MGSMQSSQRDDSRHHEAHEHPGSFWKRAHAGEN
jgi:hypothetical protein